jgi:branched-chain amino acid transport system permease protein
MTRGRSFLSDQAQNLVLGGLALATVLVVWKLLPSDINNQRGVQEAILFLGLVNGMIVGLGAIGIILVYRTTRVLNFAQTFLGGAGAVLFFELISLTPVPFPVALLLGIVGGGLMGLLFDLVFGRRFARAPRLVLTIFTIIAGQFLATRAVGFVVRLPIFPPVEGRGLSELNGGEPLQQSLPFPKFQFHIGSSNIPFRFAHLFALVMVLACLLAVYIFLQHTRIGVAVRAMAENPERAGLLGISVGLLGTVVWTLSGGLSAVSVTLTGMLGSPSLALGFRGDLLAAALAAALIGRMRSLPVALLASVAIVVLTTGIENNLPSQQPLVSVVLFLVITGALLLQARQLQRADQGSTTWESNQEVRPVPKEMSGLVGLRAGRYAIIVLLILAAVLYPLLTGTAETNLGGVLALFGIVGISMVVITGWGGQASIGQFAFAAIGAVLAGAIATRLGLTFWLAVPLAAAGTALIAAMTGFPALRIKGLFLLVSTGAFAFMVRDVLFEQKYFGWLLPGPVKRPTLFLVDFENERNMYYLSLAALLLVVVVVLNLRRSRFGRLLIAVRENEANAQSAAVGVVRTKLLAFAIAGGIAGFAGAIFAFHQRGVAADSFDGLVSIGLFTQVIVGGPSSIAGALMGILYFNLGFRIFADNPILIDLLLTSGALYILYISPSGMIGLVIRARDALLRIVAQRNQLVVPSLFADVDPEALHRRLVPLAAPVSGSGLANVARRYVLTASRFHRAEGSVVRRQEANAIRTAAASAAGPGPESAS